MNVAEPHRVRLSDFDLIVINVSGGKDSQAMLTHLVEQADAEGVERSRMVVAYADLGRVVWPGTRELVEAQAAFYGLRLEVVQRTQGLLEQVVARREALDRAADQLEAAGDAAGAERKRETPAWPSSQARYCTSDQKTSQVVKLMTREVAEWRARTGGARPMRVLNCLGIRAQESPARAKKQALHRDSASNGYREVTRWLPIFGWSVDEVWATIHRSGVPYHPAYDAGMPRLSCVMCVLAGRRELVLAARLNPELAQEYLAVERRVRHTFKADLSMAEIVAAAEREGAA